ncbi:MAG TPA: TonB-dependent receptor [Bryobacteraceae bacterium]|nr:TonB-dependent receptor [Bryobacteraceae bacterium]
MKRTYQLLYICAAFFAAAFTLNAQAITGDLLVSVTDPNGAVVPGAKLELTDPSTNIGVGAVTSGSGTYLYSQLKPGTYGLRVTATGFEAAQLDNVLIRLGQRSRVDVKLTIGAVNETVTVSASGATMLNAESASVGQVVDSKPITELPLNGRNFIQLAQLATGATPIGTGVSPATSWTGREDTTLSISGLRESDVSYLVNGIETRNPRFGNAGIRPSVDAIQEFRVQHSTFDAEFGRSAAVVNTTIKPGGNDLHMAVFELLRNRNMDANNYFSNRAGQDLPPFSQNNFGATLSGPVWIPKIYNGRNKTFFLFNYEGFRQREGNTGTATYPSIGQLGGDLADDSAGTGLYPTSSGFCQSNPSSVKCVNIIDPLSGLPFPGNQIPKERLDPITQTAIQFMPRPNVATAPGSAAFPAFNTVGTLKTRSDWDQYNVRLDQQITEKDLIYGTFSHSDESLLQPSLQFLGGDVFPMSDQLWTFTYNRIISPTILNEFRFGYNNSQTFRLSEGSNGKDYASEVFGLKNTSREPLDFGVPDFNFSGFSGVGSLSEAIGAEDENYQWSDNLSISHGKHNIGVGFQIIYEKYFQITDFSGNPSFSFDGRYTGAQGLGIGDFLLGIPYQASGALGNSAQNLSTTFWSGYIQDDWHVLPSLTINAGLRYEFAASPAEANQRSLYFDPDIGQVVTAGHGVRNGIVDPDYNNFAPRLGFAYRPSFLPRTVIRGGAGIYYATDNFNEEQFQVIGPPFYQPQTINGDPTKPTLSMANMLPPFSASANLNPFSFDRLSRTPYISQWTMDIQHSLGNDYVVEIGYNGSTGQKLPQRRNLNIASIDPTGTVPISQRVPFPNYGFVLLTYNGGWSSYQALTARLEKRFHNGLYLLASYTFQKALDLGGTDEFSATSADFKQWDKGHSTFDVPQRLVFSYLWELPFGKGKALFGNANGALDKIIGGWQLNGITTFSAGQFKTVGLNTDWLNLGAFASSRPNIIGDYTAGRSLPYQYVNSAAFAFPALHVQGNAGRNTIEVPGIANWDMSLFKNVLFRERYLTQLRLEAFNIFNHTQFGVPDLSVGSPTFGQIGGTLIASRKLQVGLRLQF